jgi:hypothetical protein
MPDIKRFKRLLAARGESISSLARKARCGRSHLSQTVHQRPGRGGHTRHKLMQFLEPEECEALGWMVWRHEGVEIAIARTGENICFVNATYPNASS